MIEYETLKDILVIPYRTFKERIALVKAYERKSNKIEVLNGVLLISLKQASGMYEL